MKLHEVKIGDLLVFYLFQPVDGIVAVCRVTSNSFRGRRDLWGENRYPYRVSVELIPELTLDEQQTIPLCQVLGRENTEEGIRIQPYLRGITLAELHIQQLERLVDLIDERAPK